MLLEWYPNKLPGYVKTRWWTDVVMLRSLLKAADLPDKPLTKLSKAMKWYIEFSEAELSELKKFVKIMGPIESLFSGLNSEKESTLHMCLPSVRETLATLKPFVDDPTDSAHDFASEIKQQIFDQYSFLLMPECPSFLAVYHTTTFLSPIHRQILSDDELLEVKKFLKSKLR